MQIAAQGRGHCPELAGGVGSAFRSVELSTSFRGPHRVAQPGWGQPGAREPRPAVTKSAVSSQARPQARNRRSASSKLPGPEVLQGYREGGLCQPVPSTPSAPSGPPCQDPALSEGRQGSLGVHEGGGRRVGVGEPRSYQCQVSDAVPTLQALGGWEVGRAPQRGRPAPLPLPACTPRTGCLSPRPGLPRAFPRTLTGQPGRRQSPRPTCRTLGACVCAADGRRSKGGRCHVWAIP